MTRVALAQIRRLCRPRTLAGTAAAVAAFAAVSTLAVLSSADDNTVASRQGGSTLAAVTGEGGGTEAFAVGASFAGFFVFVVFIALLAGEFSGGTFRANLLRQPHRLRVVGGQLAGTLAVAAGVLAAAEAGVFVLSLLLAPGQDIPTGEWFTLASAGAAAGDYLTALAGVAGWAAFGTALAVTLRSTPVALGVGFAWAGPLENIVVDSWEAGYRWFPGQVLGSLARGGTIELGMGRAAATAAVYAAAAAAISAVSVHRRDVTA